ncbi:acyl-CoA dehydrogenase family protein [Actinophytocola sp.]|uniref:acyl-CoA dehydrogenase family protein n=1 Tax=Actinophytocola sp. TaxID=1872138 RepID=UPI003D6A3790
MTPRTGADGDEESLLREVARKVAARSLLAHVGSWEEQGRISPEVPGVLAEAGLLGLGYPVAVGGEGGGLRLRLAVMDEFLRQGVPSGACAAMFGRSITVPHMIAAGDPAQVRTYVRPTLGGRRIGALAVTEPGGGSDVAGLRTRAVLDGDHYRVTGTKTFITSAIRADYYVTAVRTGEPGARGISLLVIDRDSPGLRVSAPLRKMGWLSSDTAELAFDDVAVPRANLIGAAGTGFSQLMRQFPEERVTLAAHAVGIAQRCLDLCGPWVTERVTFGSPLRDRQVIRHKIAEMATKTAVAREFLNQVAGRIDAGEPVNTEAAMAKNTAVEAVSFAVDQAVQIFGGSGYIRESEVERHYRDARILAIGGGTTEILRELIASDVLAAWREPPR